MAENRLETVTVNGLSRIPRTIYVLWALLFLCPITALAQESALTGGSEEPQKEAPAADKNSTVDSNKKRKFTLTHIDPKDEKRQIHEAVRSDLIFTADHGRNYEIATN